MSEKPENDQDPIEENDGSEARPRRRKWPIVLGAIGLAGLIVVLVLFGLFRTGAVDGYVKRQFTAKLADIGIEFTADVFRLSLNPLELNLQNATFNDRVTGDKLFFIRNAKLEMSVIDLFSWQTSRDISIDKTELNGAEAWVKFDENGRSNFSNLKLVEDQAGSAVNFKYDSVNFRLVDGTVHFGDVSRKIAADAKNVVFQLTPADAVNPTDPTSFNFELTSTDSFFAYDERRVEDIDITAKGVAHGNGAEFKQFDIRTPIGDSSLTGTLIDWASPKYSFDITSSVDLTQASDIFPLGTTLVGVGNFKGKVTGEGESYKVEGEVFTESLRADGVSLKGTSVTATVSGTNSNYEADGTAIAQQLTFDDIRVDMLKLAGNVRGTGTDFRWWGELQAAAAKAGDLSLGQLFLSDALAEYKDNKLRAQARTGRAKKFEVGDIELDGLTARDLNFTGPEGGVVLTSPSVNADAFRTEDIEFRGIKGQRLSVKNSAGRTNVDIGRLDAASGVLAGTRLGQVNANEFRLTDTSGATQLELSGVRAQRAERDGVVIDGFESPLLRIENARGETIVYSDKNRVAKLDAGAAVLGSLNIGGVRVTIRQGRVEARSDDVNAGDVALKKTSTLPDGGNIQAVTIARPVFILEPSGRYRATADMTLGGGMIGSVALGAAKAKVVADNDRVALNELEAQVMDGTVNGTAVIALNNRTRSTLKGDFRDLEISRLMALQGGTLTPVSGKTTGNIDLSFSGTNFRDASGTIDATVTANAGTAERGMIPVNGEVRLAATNGLFEVERADLRTEKSNLSATGRFDMRNENSDLTLALRSEDASEIDRLFRVLDLSPEIAKQLDDLEVQVAGNVTFDGTVTGNLNDPIVNGKASLASLALKGREVGSLSSDIFISPTGTEFRNGRLVDRTGGTADFAVNIPAIGTNNATVTATLKDINAGNLLGALPISLPEQIRDLTGKTTGEVNITGLPDNAAGGIDLVASNGSVAGQRFDDLVAKATFAGTKINIERADIKVGSGEITARGTFDRASEEFDLNVTGKTVPAGLVLALFPKNDSIPAISGDLDFTAVARGDAGVPSSYDVTFSGGAPSLTVGENALGQVAFKGRTEGQVITAELTAVLDGRPQVINGTVDLRNDNVPFTAVTTFDQSPLAPFLAFVPQLKGYAISGTATGRVEFGGDLRQLNASGEREFSAAGLRGRAEFSQLSLVFEDTPLNAIEPVLITFDPSEIVFERARFAGGGSNMTIAGRKALTDTGLNDLTIDGRVNLNILNAFVKDTFFSGFADTAVRLYGPNRTALVSGTANMVNASVAAFLGTDRFTADRIKARVIFTSNQVEIEQAEGYLGGGRFTGEGGGTLQGFSLQRFRFALSGSNVTVPLPKDFVTTGDAQLEITALRNQTTSPLQVTIGGRVYARRSVYSKDIDLANLISGRRDAVLSGGGASGTLPVRFDLVIEGRDALVVRNNIADLTASVSLVLGGDTNEPRIAGRITANSGTIFFRKDRYEVQRGVLEFPPDTAIEPIINLQAESEIGGYQIYINLSGPLNDSEQLNASVRSSPALPQADVVSLITTGTLTNSSGGIPTLASTGINTAAEILTDSIINNPVRRATDKLFGLNVFEIDPLISGQTVNPGARLTVGRQINNNLRVTYSTNLSQDQNQVLAFEYRVSNRLSFVAQYEQRSLTNVTRNRDNFSFEIRLRKRF